MAYLHVWQILMAYVYANRKAVLKVTDVNNVVNVLRFEINMETYLPCILIFTGNFSPLCGSFHYLPRHRLRLGVECLDERVRGC